MTWRVFPTCSKTTGFRTLVNRKTQEAISVSCKMMSRTSSFISRHWNVKSSCKMISSSSLFSTKRSCNIVGTLDKAKCCPASLDKAMLPTIMTHSRMMSSSEKPTTRSLCNRSSKPASHKSLQETSGSVMFASVPSNSTTRSGLSTQQSAMRTNSTIHFAILALSAWSSSCIFSATSLCDEQCRITLHNSGSRVFKTRNITCGRRPLETMTSAALG
mmetsp:Transcript_40718/g.93651  ORF Transcript_40718/g.93651 Transcript_40718/m.93651 type:complete len:216 (-) Transcript_40718:1478-2125(-)